MTFLKKGHLLSFFVKFSFENRGLEAIMEKYITISNFREKLLNMNIHVQREWMWVDWVMAAIRLVGYCLSLGNWFAGDYPNVWVGFWGLTASYVIPQMFYRPGYIKPVAYIFTEVLLSGGLTIYLAIVAPPFPSFLVILFMIISFMSSKKELIWVLPFILGVIPISALYIYGLPLEELIRVYFNYLLLFFVGQSFRVFVEQRIRMSEFLKVIEEKNKILEVYNQQVEKLTLLEERNRMSKELHDTVGHSLTAFIVGLDAVDRLIEKNPQEARKRLADIIRFARGNLTDFRKTVHDMAMNELKQPLTEILSETIDLFSHQTGVEIALQVEDKPFHVSDVAKLTFLRCLQEALTNAMKHGEAKTIIVRLTSKPTEITLTVRDNGKGSNELKQGFGLNGMKERVEALHGTFQIESELGWGTTVTCTVPMIGGTRNGKN
jgi:signal transduction histidine kinase